MTDVYQHGDHSGEQAAREAERRAHRIARPWEMGTQAALEASRPRPWLRWIDTWTAPAHVERGSLARRAARIAAYLAALARGEAEAKAAQLGVPHHKPRGRGCPESASAAVRYYWDNVERRRESARESARRKAAERRMR